MIGGWSAGLEMLVYYVAVNAQICIISKVLSKYLFAH